MPRSQPVKVTLLSSKATRFDQDSGGQEGQHWSRPSHQQPRPPRRPAPLPDPPLPNPTASLPRDGLLRNATQGEESRRGRSVCHTCLREGEREGERVTGEVSHPSTTITGRGFHVRLGACDRFPDYGLELIGLTGPGHGGPLSPR